MMNNDYKEGNYDRSEHDILITVFVSLYPKKYKPDPRLDSQIQLAKDILNKWPSSMIYWFESSIPRSRMLMKTFSNYSHVIIVNNKMTDVPYHVEGEITLDGLKLTTLELLTVLNNDDMEQDDLKDFLEGGLCTIKRFKPRIMCSKNVSNLIVDVLKPQLWYTRDKKSEFKEGGFESLQYQN